MSYQIRRLASPRQSELLHFLGGDKKILNRREASLENRHPKKQEPPTPYPSYQPETSYQPQWLTMWFPTAPRRPQTRSTRRTFEEPPERQSSLRGRRAKTLPIRRGEERRTTKSTRSGCIPSSWAVSERRRTPWASAEPPYVDLPPPYCEAAIRFREKVERRVCIVLATQRLPCVVLLCWITGLYHKKCYFYPWRVVCMICINSNKSESG